MKTRRQLLLAILLLLSASLVSGQATPSPAWQTVGSQVEEWHGDSVAMADVNGDGFMDAIVGSPYYDAYGAPWGGLVVAFHGGPSGFAPNSAWAKAGADDDAQLGSSVARAGDFNGDGYDDVIVGAPGERNVCCYSRQGSAFLYFGSPSGLGSSPAREFGHTEQWASFGETVAGIGDVNGDGYDDVAAASPARSEVRVYYGGTATATPGLVLDYDNNAGFGRSIAGVGDIDGDGYDDVVIGADSDASNRGRAYLFLGSASGLSSQPATVIEGGQAGSYLGSAVAGLGDVNHDGYADVAISEPGFDTSLTNDGRVAIFLGSTSGLSMNPSSVIVGPDASASFGSSLANVGDVDGDGRTELLIGAPMAPGGGRAWLMPGTFGSLGVRPEWLLQSDRSPAYFGLSVAGGGDANGDGYADLLVGSPVWFNHGSAFGYYGASGCNAATVPVLEKGQTALCPNGEDWAWAVQDPTHVAYQWGIENGIITTAIEGSTILYKAGETGPVRLNVRITDANGCHSERTVEIPVRTIPAPVINSPVTEICPSTTGYAQVAYDASHQSWAWSIENGTITYGADNPTVEYTAGTTGPVRLTVTVTSTDGCVATATREIPLKTIPAPVINSPVTEICPSTTGYAQVVYDSTHQSWVWSIENGTITYGADNPTVEYTARTTGPVRLTVTVTSTDGCVATATREIPLKTILAPVINSPLTEICPSTTGYAQVAYDATHQSWAWSIENGTITYGADNPTVEYTAGTTGPVRLTVTVTSTDGCVATATREIPLKTIPAPVINSPLTEICPSTTGYAQVAYDATHQSWAWSIENGTITYGANDPTVQYTAGTTGPVRLTVTVTSTDGCVATATREIPLKVVAAPVIQAYFPQVCAGSNSPAWIAYPDAASYQWSIENGTIWSNMGTEANVLFTAGTTGDVRLTVTVTTTDGCVTTATRDFAISPLPEPTISTSGPTTFCEGGSVVLTASGGSSYNWSNGETTQSITVTQPGSYSVRAISANGCDATSAETVVTVNPSPSATITPGGPTTFCEGGSVLLTASAGSSWLWSNGATTQSITATQSGSYTVTVSNASGCSTTSAATVVTANPLPAATITPDGPTTFCEGGAVWLSASPGLSYLWSTGETSSSIRVSQSGSYSVTTTNASGCMTTSAATLVTVNPLPEAAITPDGPTTFCAGGSVTLTASEGASYQWSNGATTRSITASTGGSYQVKVTNASGCQKWSAATYVTVNPAPVATVSASGPTTFCIGGSVTLTASPGTAYLWNTGETTPSITVDSTGSYHVTVTNANGCSTQSGSTSVSVSQGPVMSHSGTAVICEGSSGNTASVTDFGPGSTYFWTLTNATITSGQGTRSIVYSPTASSGIVTLHVDLANAAGCARPYEWQKPISETTATITASGPTEICPGDSVTLTASPGSAYYWSNGMYTQSIVVTTAGSYTVRVTNANGCSELSAPTVVTVDAVPTISASGPTTFCEGGSVVLTASEGVSYLWSNGATTREITASQSGSYSVVVTNARGCATSSAATAVTATPYPDATITPSGLTEICYGQTVVLTAPEGPPGTTYLWNGGAVSRSITVYFTGDYSVTVRNATGCSTTSAPTHVTVTPQVIAAVSGGGSICAGGSTTISATLAGTAPWTITWSDGVVQSGITTNVVTRTVSPATATSYSITAASDAHCSSSSSSGGAYVYVQPLPTATVSGGATICEGQTATVTATLTGSGPWTLTWSDGLVQSGISTSQVTRIVNPSLTTTYSVTSVTGAASCAGAATGSATITVNRKPTITAPPASKTIKKNTATTLTVGATGTGTLSYQWYKGASGVTTTPVGTNSPSYTTPKLLATTSYWVKVTNSCGSTNSATATVTIR